VKEANSSRWYWDSTGEDVTIFDWAEGRPGMGDAVRLGMAMKTRPGSPGNYDETCDFKTYGKICEEILV